MGTDDDEYRQQLELQRQAFEAQFGSLESMGFSDKTKELDSESEESGSETDNDTSSGSEEDGVVDGSEEEEEFAGFSSGSEEEKSDKPKKQPRVIKFSGPSDTYIPPSKKEQKLLKSGKTLNKNRRLLEEDPEEKKENDEDEEGALEAENLKNDIELQRFLKESHILSAFNSTSSGASLTLDGLKDTSIAYQDDEVMGKARARTLEMRLNNISQVNGHEKKISKLEKVPMHIRKGMVDKHVQRINKYEEDAADAGIVLSKVKKGQFRKIQSTYVKDIERRIGKSIKTKDQEKSKKRTRGLKIQSVGRSTRNGLVLSPEDIAKINGKKRR
ncbi:Protein FAF1 [Nakaseomyces bracarensis]|uniref:Protein FAF1 n=1 Tax=Nakaseomyces bracarensis TaxID=273131 RepID=A0ABR4NW39_9SACH